MSTPISLKALLLDALITYGNNKIILMKRFKEANSEMGNPFSDNDFENLLATVESEGFTCYNSIRETMKYVQVNSYDQLLVKQIQNYIDLYSSSDLVLIYVTNLFFRD